jgi:hypothetical protein
MRRLVFCEHGTGLCSVARPAGVKLLKGVLTFATSAHFLNTFNRNIPSGSELQHCNLNGQRWPSLALSTRRAGGVEVIVDTGCSWVVSFASWQKVPFDRRLCEAVSLAAASLVLPGTESWPQTCWGPPRQPVSQHVQPRAHFLCSSPYYSVTGTSSDVGWHLISHT